MMSIVINRYETITQKILHYVFADYIVI